MSTCTHPDTVRDALSETSDYVDGLTNHARHLDLRLLKSDCQRDKRKTKRRWIRNDHYIYILMNICTPSTPGTLRSHQYVNIMIVTYPPPLRFCRISLAIRFEQSLVAHHQAHHCLVCLVSLGSAMHGATHELTCSDNLCFYFSKTTHSKSQKLRANLALVLAASLVRMRDAVLTSRSS